MRRLLLLLAVTLLCISVGSYDGPLAGSFSRDLDESFQAPGQNPQMDTVPRLDELTELKRGDILVRGNHNWFPGTCFVENGNAGGHAVIVLNDVRGRSTNEVLGKARIFESTSRKLPDALQLRRIQAYFPDPDPLLNNISFGPQYKGYRYRLRMKLAQEKIDSIISFIEAQDPAISSWRSAKFFRPLKSDDPVVVGTRTWYCTLLIWQAFYQVLGVDLDFNRGLIVFPNDLINSPYFNNSPREKENRVRF